MSVFLTSDLHFGHERIIEMCDRPFGSVDEMNEALIANHNNLVNPMDTVYFLGDVAMGKIADSLPLVDRMNGVKILIAGNHDRCSPYYKHKREDIRETWYQEYRKYFSLIIPSIELMLGPHGQSILLHHFPYADPSYKDHSYEGRYQEFQPENNNLWLLHGHVHTGWKIKGKQINCGVDVWNFCPVEIAAVQQLMLEQSQEVQNEQES